MGIEVNCDSRGKSTDDVYCEICSSPSAGGDVSQHVEELAAAIRRGDRHDAEMLLDRIASEFDDWSEYVSRGRYGWKAKRAA